MQFRRQVWTPIEKKILMVWFSLLNYLITPRFFKYTIICAILDCQKIDINKFDDLNFAVAFISVNATKLYFEYTLLCRLVVLYSYVWHFRTNLPGLTELSCFLLIILFAFLCRKTNCRKKIWRDGGPAYTLTFRTSLKFMTL